MSVAALKSVRVDYGGRPALAGLDLEIDAGEILSLVGPSGCGKSTALRLLAGLEQPTGGVVERAQGRGETSVVFQSPTLAPWLSALDNVALPLQLAGEALAEARKKAVLSLERVGLGASAQARPAQLSGGMAMRVSLARALVTRPRLLLLDEPFAALDEITRRSLADDILELWSTERPAIVFVTHNVEEAVYMASRVVVLSAGPGRIMADIRPDAPLPRQPSFRTSALFRDVVEAVSGHLARGMEKAS